MKLGICCISALGWRTVKRRWAQVFPEATFYDPEPSPLLCKIGQKTLAKSLGMRRAVRQAIRDGCDRVLIATNGEATLVPLADAQKVAIYGDASHRQLDELYGFGRPEHKNASRERALRRLFASGARGLAMSTWAVEGFLRDYGDTAHHIPGCVDTTLFRPGSTRPDGPFRVLFVGGNLARKGAQLAIDATADLPGVELLIVGGTLESPPPHVRCAGWVEGDSPAMVAAYQSADLFLFPTTADCYSHVIIEAQACGVPVMASVTGGIRDLIVDGETGIEITGLDAVHVRDRIAAFREHPPGALSENAHKRILGLHSFHKQSFFIYNALQ